MAQDDGMSAASQSAASYASYASHDAASISSSNSRANVASLASQASQVSAASSGGMSSASKSQMSMMSGGFSDTGSEKLQGKVLKQLPHNSFRRNLMIVIGSNLFNNFMLTVIISNTIVLALQTSNSIERPYGWYFGIMDTTFLAIYLMEAALKIFAFRAFYFKSGWNIFDFIIVVSSLSVFFFQVFVDLFLNVNSEIFRLLRLIRAIRAIRSLRVLRTINFMKSLQIILSTLLKSIPAMGTIMFLQALAIYMFAVIGKSLYSTVDPRRFGSLASASFRMFQMITLDNWGFIYTDNKEKAPTIWIFLWVYIVLAQFILTNLFVAVIVSNLQVAQRALLLHRKKKKSKKQQAAEELANELEDVWSKARGQDISQLNELAELFRKSPDAISNFYPENLSQREKELYANYFMLIASLESNTYSFEKQQKSLDDLVDALKQAGDKE